MNRTFLHEQGYGPFFSAFDPFRNIALAKRDHGWIIDYCHCPLEKPVHPNKDCSEAQLRERIKTVVSEGGDEAQGAVGGVWLARVEDAVDYRYARRHAKIARKSEAVYEISAPDLPAQVRRTSATLELPPGATSDRAFMRNGTVLVNVELTRQPQTIRISKG